MFEGRKGEGNLCERPKANRTHTGGEGVRVALFCCTALQKCVVFLIT